MDNQPMFGQPGNLPLAPPSFSVRIFGADAEKALVLDVLQDWMPDEIAKGLLGIGFHPHQPGVLFAVWHCTPSWLEREFVRFFFTREGVKQIRHQRHDRWFGTRDV